MKKTVMVLALLLALAAIFVCLIKLFQKDPEQEELKQPENETPKVAKGPKVRAPESGGQSETDSAGESPQV